MRAVGRVWDAEEEVDGGGERDAEEEEEKDGAVSFAFVARCVLLLEFEDP